MLKTRSLTSIHPLIARRLNSARKYFAFECVAIITFACAAALIAAPQQNTARKPAKPPAPAGPAALSAPFHSGESLAYSGQWLSLKDVIAAQLSANDDLAFNGHPAWHFQAQLQTKNPLRYVLQVDDHFDSYSGHSDLVGEQFEMHLNEGAKSENHISRLTPGQSSAPAGTIQLQVIHGTRDALGFLYYLRTVNWQQTKEVRAPVFDGRKVYDVHATVVTPRSDITVAAGKFTAIGLSVRAYLNSKELPDTKITVWIAQDFTRTPVLIELELPIGSGRVELTEQSPGK